MKAVFLHLFYTDLLKENIQYLSRLPFTYDIYVTVPIGAIGTIDEIKKWRSDAHIIEVPNKGFDVGPFFEALNHSFDLGANYDWILKLHTKRSIKRGKNGDKWRIRFYNKLIPENFNEIETLFKNEKIGMIGDSGVRMGLTPLDKRNGTNINGPNLKKIIDRFKLSNSELDFFSGTMFWIKYDTLKKTFYGDRLTCDDFEEEYKSDGTLAHAYERAFANVVKSNGYDLYGI